MDKIVSGAKGQFVDKETDKITLKSATIYKPKGHSQFTYLLHGAGYCKVALTIVLVIMVIFIIDIFIPLSSKASWLSEFIGWI